MDKHHSGGVIITSNTTGKGKYYGRSVSGNPPYQLLSDHLAEVEMLTGEYCQPFTEELIGNVAGIMHDIGKYSQEFQRKVKGEKLQISHSLAGAKEVYNSAEQILKAAQNIATPDNRVQMGTSALTCYLLSYIIAGHHTGLPDYGNANAEQSTLYQRLNNEPVADYSAWNTEITINIKDEITINIKDINPFTVKPNQKEIGFSYFLYTHFLFSCLIDADRTSAANFPVKHSPVSHISLEEMQSILTSYMDSFNGTDSELNTIRNSIRNSCLKAADSLPGMFTLTVPTGGGKTLASLSFALKHAVRNKQSRVIYTIPFTSIIEQNAAVYKRIFGDENVLEHHSNFMPSADVQVKESIKMKLATENWDAPLIVTTNVQFFESLFSANPSRSRKVHNIANSVIILDEVQALPNELLKPCMATLSELVKRYNCTVVLCTATQPNFKDNGLLPDIVVTDIIPNYPELAEKMRRTSSEYIGRKSNEDIATSLLREKQVLCIVNTKKHAREIYSLIKKDGNCFHLSTNMYPSHRRQVISDIRKALNEGRKCRVVSTQLIEAGVDIDFPVVYRSLAGVDSIVQAAGRCNREGKLKVGQVYVFEPENLYVTEGYLKQTADITATFKTDLNLLSDEAIKRYFKELFSLRDELLDKPSILKTCSQSLGFPPRYPFRKISEKFKMIADDGTAVVIPTPEVSEILKELNEINLKYILKMISPYCVNVYENQLQNLIDSNVIHREHDAFFVLSDLKYYDSEMGLTF